MKILKRVVVTAALVAAPIAVAQPADAGVAGCTLTYVTLDNIQVRPYVDCTFNSLGNCIFLYDPLFDPFPEQVAPATLQLVFCTAL